MNLVEMERFNEIILSCPNYLENKCNGLTKITGSRYKHGPEISYVGLKYGESNFPRLLFTRLNCPWHKDIGWFGTKESIEEFKLINKSSNFHEIQNAYLNGWSYQGKKYRGMKDAGTVTGHPNITKISSEDRRNNPRYGIQLIMEEMIDKDIFPNNSKSPLDYCSINNVIKCSGGKGGKDFYNPSTSMKARCHYYEKELEILDPHIIIVLGNKTHKILRRRFHPYKKKNNLCYIKYKDKEIQYWVFPHPNGPGKYTWKGKKVEQLIKNNPYNHKLTKKEQYYNREYLYNYVMNLVWETCQIMDEIIKK